MQGLLYSLTYLGRPKWFTEARHTDFGQKLSGLRAQRISRKKDDLAQEVGIAALQLVVEPWAIELRHTQITQNQIIRLLPQLGQPKPPIRRGLDCMAVATQQVGQRGGDPHFIIDNQYSFTRDR